MARPPEPAPPNAPGPETVTSLREKLKVFLTGLPALGYYISAVLHLAAYGIGLLLAYWLGLRFTAEEPEPHVPLAASLADETVEDDAAKLEIISEVSMGTADSESSTDQLASFLRTENKGWLETLPTDALQSFSASEKSDANGEPAAGLMFRMPESGLAVTRGSFTAWTEPASPGPGQNYLIIIQIRLPNDVTRYRLADLSGEVRGSDNYRQKIPYERSAPMASGVSTARGLRPVRPGDTVDVVDNKVQLAIKVPGASRLVRDTITIRSRRLREDQELVLVFGQPASPEKLPAAP